MKKIFNTIICLLLTVFAFAQSPAGDQPTGLRADGKIYVVIAVVVTILIGLFLYVIRLDRKISKLEKQHS
ncbi:MAG: CcmD family protein [Chitinophagaceae bacterium]